MSAFRLIKDNAFVIMMLVGMMQFMFTVFITAILHRNARRQLSFEVLRSIDSQWQDLNKMLISNPEVQLALSPKHDKESNSHAMIRLNLLYYTLNTFQQITRARENGFITKETAERLIAGHMDFFKQIPGELNFVLNNENGFDNQALDELRNHWKQVPLSRS